MAAITSSSHLLSAIIMDCPRGNSSIKPLAMSWRYMSSGFLINRPTITLMYAPRDSSQYRKTHNERCAQCITISDMQIFDMRDAHKARAWADYMWRMSQSMEDYLHTRIVLSSSTMMKLNVMSDKGHSLCRSSLLCQTRATQQSKAHWKTNSQNSQVAKLLLTYVLTRWSSLLVRNLLRVVARAHNSADLAHLAMFSTMFGLPIAWTCPGQPWKKDDCDVVAVMPVHDEWAMQPWGQEDVLDLFCRLSLNLYLSVSICNNVLPF